MPLEIDGRTNLTLVIDDKGYNDILNQTQSSFLCQRLWNFNPLGKSLSRYYGQKLLDTIRKSETDTLKTASKKMIQE